MRPFFLGVICASVHKCESQMGSHPGRTPRPCVLVHERKNQTDGYLCLILFTLVRSPMNAKIKRTAIPDRALEEGQFHPAYRSAEFHRATQPLSFAVSSRR